MQKFVSSGRVWSPVYCVAVRCPIHWTTNAQIGMKQDERKINLNLKYFLCTSPTYPSHCAIVYFSEILTQNSIKCGNIHARRTNGIEIELCNFIFLNRTKIIFSRARSQKRTNKVNMLHMIQQKWSSIQSTIFSMHSILHHKTISLNFPRRIGILLPKLFWHTVRKNYSSDREHTIPAFILVIS